MENGETKLIWPKEWLELCAMISKDGAKDMMRNVFYVNNLLHSTEEGSKSNLLLVKCSLPNLRMNILYSSYMCTQMVKYDTQKRS